MRFPLLGGLFPMVQSIGNHHEMYWRTKLGSVLESRDSIKLNIYRAFHEFHSNFVGVVMRDPKNPLQGISAKHIPL